MITCVTYSGEKTARFDREYYVQQHLPLVRRTWEHAGLEAIDAFFPVDAGAGFVAIAVCKFRDAAAFEAALAEPGTAEVMADVRHFTDLTPVHFQFSSIPFAGRGTKAGADAVAARAAQEAESPL